MYQANMLSGTQIPSPTSQLSTPTPVSTSEDKGHNSPAIINNINSRLHGCANSEAHPPPTQLIKINSVAGPSVVRKEKQLTSSRFNGGQNRGLFPLPLIKETGSLLERTRVSCDAEVEPCGQARVGIALSHRAEQCLIDWIPVNSRLCTVKLNTSIKTCRRNSEKCCVFIILAYVLKGSCSDAVKDAFCVALIDLLRQTKHSDNIVLAGNPNAQLGRLSPEEERLGGMFGVRAQLTDSGGKLLQLCASHGVSSTAFQHKKKHRVTW
ncbi:uncharacterized protein DEA37_0002776 [Paragonimus westermani]|uniref:Uncharacterized protein n=1 Tax=Paragonimus westermani TaxID=34504 RepID=A0A5J4NP40_9TREM|nr:uncharacterized protein DEA37_0002776 [Paragonimus westermani]